MQQKEELKTGHKTPYLNSKSKPIIITHLLEQFVKIRLNDLNLSKRQLTIAMRIRVPYFDAVMNGNRTINPNFIQSLADNLQTNTDYLNELIHT